MAAAQAEAGAGHGMAKEHKPDGEDEEGIPIYSPRTIESMETGQIVIQFLKVEDVKPANLYLQAKLLAPTKHLLHETEVIKKGGALDWSAWPPTIHNVKDAAHSILKIQLTKKNPLDMLDKIVGEVVIKVSDMAPGVPYTRWYELGLKEKDQDKKFKQKLKGHLGKVQVNLMYFNINSKFLNIEFTHPVHALIKKRYVDGVFHLIEKEKRTEDIHDADGNTCLHYAAEYDVPEVVALLFQHGFNMKRVNNKDQTPLHLAAGHSGAVTKILLSKGANVHADDKDGNLPIHYAARHDCGDAIEALCGQGGADANAKNRNGEVPLVIAVKANAASAVRALAAAGADPFLADAEGQSVSDLFFSKKEKLGGGGTVLVADGAERQVHEDTFHALLESYNCDDPRELMMMKAGFRQKTKLIGSRIAHVFSTRTQQWTLHSPVAQSAQLIINFAQSRGLQNEKIAFVIVSRPFPTTFRHVSPVQNVVAYAEEDPITLVMDPGQYYTVIPYTKHPELKGDFSIIIYNQADKEAIEVVELKEWPYGDQLESSWRPGKNGGAQPSPDWEKNPHFALRVNRKRNDVQVAIMLQQPRLATDMIPFQVQEYTNHIGFYVYAGDKTIEKVCDSADTWINAREVWTYINIDGTKIPKLLIIPTTYKPGVDKAFTIKVACNHKCRLNELGDDGKDISRDAPEAAAPKAKGKTTKKASSKKKSAK